jgi:hypothetical protein
MKITNDVIVCHAGVGACGRESPVMLDVIRLPLVSVGRARHPNRLLLETRA